MGDTDDGKKTAGEQAAADENEDEKSEDLQTEGGDEGTVAVESKKVGYVIMNADFYKEPKKSIRITGPSSAYEYVSRKPRN